MRQQQQQREQIGQGYSSVSSTISQLPSGQRNILSYASQHITPMNTGIK